MQTGVYFFLLLTTATCHMSTNDIIMLCLVALLNQHV